MTARLRPLLLASCLPLLGACALLGGGGKDSKITIYSPLPTQPASAAAISGHPGGVTADWQLGIARPSAARMLDSPRIAVRPTPQELQVYRGATWSMPATDLLEAAVLRVLEDGGQLAGVARLTSGLHSDYRLVMDVRRFEADYAGQATPTATIEVSAKLLHSQTQKVVASERFMARTPANATALEQVVPAFAQSLDSISRQIAAWTLARGQVDRQRSTPAN